MYTVTALVFVMVLVGYTSSTWPWTATLVPLSTVLAYVVVHWRRKVTVAQLYVNVAVAKLMGIDIDWVHMYVDDVSRSTMAVDYRHFCTLAVSVCCALDFINTSNFLHLVGSYTPCVLLALHLIVIGQNVKLTIYSKALEQVLEEAQRT
jgi:hypothetical protein